MNAKPGILLAASLMGAVIVTAQTVPERAVIADTLYSSGLTLTNPALISQRQSVSLSKVKAGFERRHLGEAAVNCDGKGYGFGFFDAATYMKLGKATITGNASYSNGTRFGISLCEVSDPSVVYPYFTADETGGNLRSESYVFGGSYSSYFHGGDWLYGAALNYRATQEYRQRDPRPKNTVGKLDLEAGIGRKLGDYIVALAGDTYRYTQTSSIMFVSEIGEVKIYHLTGLGNNYHRFAGMGRNAGYSGWSRGAMLSLWPTERGVYASARYARFSFDKILKDINNLPVSSAAENTFQASAGWKASNFRVGADVEYKYRRGDENIFGDPAGNVYPELFSIESFKMKDFAGAVTALWRRVSARQRFDIVASVRYFRKKETYEAVSPNRRLVLENITPAVTLQWVRTLTDRWQISLDGTFKDRIPVSSSLEGIEGEDNMFTDGVRHDFRFMSGHCLETGLKAGVDYAVTKSYSIGLSLAGSYISYRNDNNGYHLTAAAAFTF